MQPTVSELKTWALQAGEILRAGFGGRHQVSYKGATDLVTEVDGQSESFLVERIRNAYPDHSIVTEESGRLAGRSEQRWYIDPLDGTVNYAHGLPCFSVSLAYAEGGRVQIGVVYDPMREECFSAWRGGGAWLNDRPIRVGGATELIKCLMVTGFPYEIRDTDQNNLDHFRNFALRCQGMRRLGSAALDLCYLAAGRVDGYWEIDINSYDIAAGALVVEEAGGLVTTVNGSTDYLAEPTSVVSANAHIHPQMIEILKNGAG